jgi:hypothetical protein
MALYDDLNTVFPDHYYFYTVGNMDMSQALDVCARLSGEDTHVIQYQGMTVFAVKHQIGDGSVLPNFLTAVPGNPTQDPSTPPA